MEASFDRVIVCRVSKADCVKPIWTNVNLNPANRGEPVWTKLTGINAFAYQVFKVYIVKQISTNVLPFLVNMQEHV
jgi:hypothetical protein